MNKQEFLDVMKEREKIYGIPEILRYKGWEVDHYRGVAGIYDFAADGNRFEIVLNFHKSTLYMTNGAKYEGEWKWNKFHGKGAFTYSYGKVLSGRWRANKFLN